MCIKGLTGRIRRGVDAARHPPHPAGSVPSPSGTGWLNYEKYTISLSLETFIKKSISVFQAPIVQSRIWSLNIGSLILKNPMPMPTYTNLWRF